MSSVEKAAVVLSFVGSLVVNGLSSTGLLGGLSIGEVSDNYPTYVTPDGLTFSIWAVIYTLELVLVIRQIQPDDYMESLLQKGCPLTGLSVRWRLVLAFVTNAIWLPVYVNLFFGMALLIIIVYLAFLLSVYGNLNTKTASSFCEWLTFCAGIACNASWVVVATCANAFTVLGQLGWKTVGQTAAQAFEGETWEVAGTPLAAGVVAVAVAVVGIFMAAHRSDLAWSLVVSWALAGLYRAHTVPDPESFPVEAMSRLLAEVAIWCSAVVLLASVVGIFLGSTNRVFQGGAGLTGAVPLSLPMSTMSAKE